MKTGDAIILAAVFLIVGMLAANWYIKSKGACYDLPEDGPTTYWGPKYWAAIHSIAARIPCSLCRDEGAELFSFAHDYVNSKTDKPLFAPDNYNKWLDKFAEIKKKRDESDAK